MQQFYVWPAAAVLREACRASFAAHIAGALRLRQLGAVRVRLSSRRLSPAAVLARRWRALPPLPLAAAAAAQPAVAPTPCLPPCPSTPFRSSSVGPSICTAWWCCCKSSSTWPAQTTAGPHSQTSEPGGCAYKGLRDGQGTAWCTSADAGVRAWRPALLLPPAARLQVLARLSAGPALPGAATPPPPQVPRRQAVRVQPHCREEPAQRAAPAAAAPQCAAGCGAGLGERVVADDARRGGGSEAAGATAALDGLLGCLQQVAPAAAAACLTCMPPSHHPTPTAPPRRPRAGCRRRRRRRCCATAAAASCTPAASPCFGALPTTFSCRYGRLH